MIYPSNHTTSLQHRYDVVRLRIDIETTSCVYWNQSDRITNLKTALYVHFKQLVVIMMYVILDLAGLSVTKKTSLSFSFGATVYETFITALMNITRILIKTNHKLCNSQFETVNVMLKTQNLSTKYILEIYQQNIL